MGRGVGGLLAAMPLFTILHLKPLSPDLIAVLQVVWRIALVLSAVGFFTRAPQAGIVFDERGARLNPTRLPGP